MTRDATDDLLDVLLDAHPGVHGALRELHAAAFETADAELLELCRARIGLLIGLGIGWSPRPFTDRERACLDLTEQLVLDVAGVTDAQVAAVVAQLGDSAALDFLYALVTVEQRLRMQAMWVRLGVAVAS